MTLAFPNATRIGQSYVHGNRTWSWDGAAWHADPVAGSFASNLTAAARASLLYEVTAIQDPLSSIGLGTTDLHGNSYTLRTSYPFEQIMVWVNGLLLAEDDGTGLVGDWTTDTALNSIDFVTPLVENDVLQIVVLTPPELASIGSVNAHEVLDLDIDWTNPLHPSGEIDGIQTVFELYYMDATATEVPIDASASAEVAIFIDGVQQQPTVDYTVSGSTLTFLTGAPGADTGVWAIWYQPAATAQGVLSYGTAAELLADTPAEGSVGTALDEDTVWLKVSGGWSVLNTRPFANLTALQAWAPGDGATAIDETTGLRYQRIAGAWAPQTIWQGANYAAIAALVDVLTGQMAIDLATSTPYVWTGSVWQAV